MSHSPLLVRAAISDADGLVHRVTPQSAGWTYVGFETHDLPAGGRIARDTENREVGIVMVSGRARVMAGGEDLGVIGGRASVFEAPPWSVYVPARSRYTVEAEGLCEVALCSAPGTGAKPVLLIPPAAVPEETRGKGSNTRHVRNILADTDDRAESLLVVEVITPPGNWSSYPPHKHDRDAFPDETLLEESYYHRFEPKQGYGVQRVYTDDRSLDETMTIHDRDVVLVPRGYHPVGAAHGYTLYYLNVMAGPRRTWRFHNDPDHAWLLQG